jgi:hypothetical protein
MRLDILILSLLDVDLSMRESIRISVIVMIVRTTGKIAKLEKKKV